MAKSVYTRQASNYMLKTPDAPTSSLNLLATQLRRAIYSKCIPKLCQGCRKMCLSSLHSNRPFPALSSLCPKCRQTVLKTESTYNNGKETNGLAEKFFAFFAACYAGWSGASNEISKTPVASPIITRTKVDTSSIYPYLTALNRPWCRYCGVTVSCKWKQGPWGPNSLCNGHGSDDSGNVLFDLHDFEGEGKQRLEPILSKYCCHCWKATEPNSIKCNGCSLSFHEGCTLSHNVVEGAWYCSPECVIDRRKRIVRGKIGFDERMPFTIDLLSLATPSVSKLSEIVTPRFSTHVPSQSRRQKRSKQVEEELIELDECACVKRHCRYENIEKNNHLLRPQVMRKLFPKKFK